MANKITPVVLTSGFASIAPLNLNFNSIATELNDKVLYRDTAEPNQMEVNLDMNSQRIINLPAPENGNDAVRFSEIVDGVATTDTVMPSPMGNVGKVLGTDGSLFVFQNSVKNTLADITLLTKATLTTGVILRCAGRTTTADNGGGTFRWDSSSTATEDGGTIFASDEGGTGRWIKIDFSFVSPEMFAAVGDGATDDTTALKNFFPYLARTGKMGVLKEKATYLYDSSTGAHVSSAEEPMRFITLGVAATIKFVNTKLTKFLDMTSVTSVHISNVIIDANSLSGYIINLRNSSATDLLGSVYVKDVTLLNIAETTQNTRATGIYTLGRFRNITYDGIIIPSITRTTTSQATQALIAERTTGNVLVQNCIISNVVTPEDQNADAIVVFGAENIDTTKFDTGSVLVTNNYLIDFMGRGVKGQHTNMTVASNQFELTDDTVTITNWHCVDLQSANGVIVNNRLRYGANITKIGGGTNSAVPWFIQNNKDTDTTQYSIVNNNVVSALTKLAFAVGVKCSNGNVNTQTTIIITGNDFGKCNGLVQYEGIDSDIGLTCTITMSDNSAECKSHFLNIFDKVAYTKLFIRITDNTNYDTIILNFRPIINFSGSLSLGSNFVIGRNKGFRELIEWTFDANSIQAANDFEVGAQSINNDPTSPPPGTGAHWVTSYNLQRIINSAGTIVFQRTNTDENSAEGSWNGWKKSTTWTAA